MARQNLVIRDQSSPNYAWTVVLVSAIIMVFQGISSSNLGLISQLTHQKGNDWAGPLSQCLLFLGLGLGSLYNQYIGRHPYNRCFFVGSLGKTLYISLGLIFIKLGFSSWVETLIFFSSFISGLVVSVFYVTEYNYINSLSRIDGHAIKYFGLNIGIMQASGFFGSFLSMFLIEPLGQFYYILVMDIVIFLVSCLFLVVVKDPKKRTSPQPQQQQQIQQQQQYASAGPIVRDQSDNLRTHLTNQPQQIHSKLSPFYCAPSFAFTGVSIAFIYTAVSIMLYRRFEGKFDNIELNKLTFNVLVFEGIGALLGGLLMFSLSKKIKDAAKASIILSSSFMLFAVLVYIGCLTQNLIPICVGVFGAGFCHCSNVIVVLSIAGNWVKRGITSYTLCQCIVVAISVVFIVLVSFEVLLGWMAFFYIAAVVSLIKYRTTLLSSPSTMVKNDRKVSVISASSRDQQNYYQMNQENIDDHGHL